MTHDQLWLCNEPHCSVRVYIVLRLKQKEDDAMGLGKGAFGTQTAWIVFLVLILLLLGTWGGQLWGV